MEQITVLPVKAKLSSRLAEFLTTTLHVVPEKNRKDSFWFDGHVATIEIGNIQVRVIATGKIGVTFNNEDNSFWDKEAVAEATKRGYTDKKLNHSNTDWSNNNWFGYEVIKDNDEKTVYWDTSTDTNLTESLTQAANIAVEKFGKIFYKKS